MIHAEIGTEEVAVILPEIYELGGASVAMWRRGLVDCGVYVQLKQLALASKEARKRSIMQGVAKYRTYFQELPFMLKFNKASLEMGEFTHEPNESFH